jgi:protein-tyrosine kinase
MSRIHEALRKAGQDPNTAPDTAPALPPRQSPPPGIASPGVADSFPAGRRETVVIDAADLENLEEIIQNAQIVPNTPSADALMVNAQKPREAPAEEFRTLRTRLNHLQSTNPLRTLVITSASPAEGKSFTATNLALTQAQLADKRILLADFDFRRPTVEKAFQVDRSPGLTEYLLGKATLKDILRRVEGTNLYLLTAGEPVSNPLELLNLKECKALIDSVREAFDWVILDSPPLLFAADANLLATMCDGTVLVVRIGATTFDSVSRALQSLCENNVLGIVVNGARRGELYSKYTYYYDDYEDQEQESAAAPATLGEK